MNTDAMYKIGYGLYILTAASDGRDNGCIVNTVTQVTSTPNRIAVTVNKDNHTHDMIMSTGVFNVSVLAEDVDFGTFEHWGFRSGRDTDKLCEIEYCRHDNGVVYITGHCNAFICARVIEHIDLGTHTMFLADVTDCDVLSNDPSVTYSYYHSNIKPAPAASGRKGYVCTICGYIYDGEELPADYICPLCKHPASDFVPLG